MANWLKIEISTKHTRPIVVTENNISCLIDTGADTPVWISGSLALVGRLNAEKIVFKEMIVACTERPAMAAHLILPATIFSHMNYLIHNVGVKVPMIEIEHDKEEYFVQPLYSTIDKRILQRVYSFASEEEE